MLRASCAYGLLSGTTTTLAIFIIRSSQQVLSIFLDVYALKALIQFLLSRYTIHALMKLYWRPNNINLLENLKRSFPLFSILGT